MQIKKVRKYATWKSCSVLFKKALKPKKTGQKEGGGLKEVNPDTFINMLNLDFSRILKFIFKHIKIPWLESVKSSVFNLSMSLSNIIKKTLTFIIDSQCLS